jgi:hypothetical protein
MARGKRGKDLGAYLDGRSLWGLIAEAIAFAVNRVN